MRVMSRQRPEGIGVRGFDGASVRQVGASSGSWGVVIARQGPRPVGRLLASPNRFLMGTGGRLDRADQLAISRQRPVGVAIGTQDIGQHDRITADLPSACAWRSR